jgi:Tol biopolymer transport system component
MSLFARAAVLTAGFAMLLGCHTAAKTLPPDGASGAGTYSAVRPSTPNLQIEQPGSDGGTRTFFAAHPITSLGENSQARYSADGTKLLYISRARANHEQAQVYLLNLANMTERRLTFHDGDDSRPTWAGDGRFLFASTTDEKKEIPHVIDRLMRTYDAKDLKGETKPVSEGLEIYQQSFDGLMIERLTRSPGNDTDPDFESKKSTVIYSSDRDGSANLYRLGGLSAQRPGNQGNNIDAHIRAVNLNRLTNGKFEDRGPRVSPDGRTVVWTRTSDGGKTSQIFIASLSDPKKTTHALTPLGEQSVDPSWNPMGNLILFSSNHDSKFLNLFTIDVPGTCLKQLTQVEVDQLDPEMSPDGTKITFTAPSKPDAAKGDSKTQVYLADYKAPADCIAGASLPSLALPSQTPTQSSSPSQPPTAAPAPKATVQAATSPAPSPTTAAPAKPAARATPLPTPAATPILKPTVIPTPPPAPAVTTTSTPNPTAKGSP